jgi:hypothetical protein
MKKTISNLRINDTMFVVYSGRVIVVEVISISKTIICTRSKEYGEFKAEISEADRTSWSFITKPYSSTYVVYTEKIDALLEFRKILDKNLKNIFHQQQKFYEKVSDKNTEIRKNDALIAIELRF